MSVSNDPVGLCFEPLIALANHSCTPNAAIVFDGRKIMLRALNPIKKGEQVFISYIDNTERRATRQAELREEYFFGCGCVKCTKGDSHYSSWLKHPHDSSNPRPDRLTDPQKLESDARSATSASATMMVEGVSLEICPDFQTLLHNARNMPHQITRLKMLTEVLLLLRPFREVGRYAEPSFIAVLSDIHLLYLDGESIPSALILLIFMHLNCYAFAYPQPHHPSNVVRLFTIARLCRVMPVLLERKGSSLTEKLKPGGKALQAFVGVTDWISAAQCILIEIIELAALSHGKESRFMKEVKSELETVEKLQQLTGRGETRDKLKQWGGRGDQTVDGSSAGLEYAKKMFEALKDLGGTASAQEVMEWGLHLLPLDEQEIAAMDS
jgi:SET and MYND domain-containing protein